MGKLTINKGEMKRYLEAQILPLLGPEWHVYDATIAFRWLNQLAIQGIHFERSSHANRFAVWYFVFLLCPATDTLTIGLGDRLRDGRGAEVWFDWDPHNKQQTARLISICYEQSKPSICRPLTLDAIADFLQERSTAGEIAVVSDMAVVEGLQGRLEQAKAHLEEARGRLLKRRAEWQQNKKLVPEYVDKQLRAIQEMRLELETSIGSFREYCQAQARSTMAALKLVHPVDQA